MENKLSRYWKLVLILFSSVLLLNLISLWTGFSDFYRLYIYKPVSIPISRLTSFSGVALGEIVMYLGILVVILSVIAFIVGLFFKKSHVYRRMLKRIYKAELIGILIVFLIFTFSWSIPLRASKITFENDRSDYSITELQQVRNYTLEQMEINARRVPRDENNAIKYNDDMEYEVLLAVKKLSDEYPLLRGYQPPMKKALCSDILEWMGISGYTYPFTKEITYNKYTTRFEFPSVYCHELAHHNGYYRESEAEFLGIIALQQSDNPILQYAGYQDAYYWLDNAYMDSLIAAYGVDEAIEIYAKQPQESDLIYGDRFRNIEEYEEHYNAEVNETFENAVKPYAENAADTGWDTQADILGDANYDGAVRLLLNYYYEEH